MRKSDATEDNTNEKCEKQKNIKWLLLTELIGGDL